MTELVEATVVDESQEVAVVQPPASLFRTDDPAEVIVKATATADALKSVLKSRGLVQNISGKEHVKVEGWTLLGSMLGVTGVVTWTRAVENGWEARVEARTLDGRVIGAAEAECLRSEKMWGRRDDYALRSMAQTRAMSKALRGPLGFVVHLAGYEATPAEEMPAPTMTVANVTVPPAAEPAPTRNAKPASKARIAAIRKGVESIGLEDKLPLALAHVGAQTLDDLDADQASKIEKWLEGKAADNG